MGLIDSRAVRLIVEGWTRLWFSRPVAIPSPLPPDLAAERLDSGAVNDWKFLAMTVPSSLGLGSRERMTAGYASTSHVFLRACRPSGYYTARPTFTGRVTAASPVGSVLTGRIGCTMYPRVSLAVPAGVGVLLLLFGTALGSVLIAGIGLAIVAIMIISLIAIGLMYKADEEFLLAWLKRRLDTYG